MPLSPAQDQAVARIRKALAGKTRDVEHVGPAHRPESIVKRHMAAVLPADLVALCEAIGPAPKALEMLQAGRRALDLGTPAGAGMQASCLHELLELLDAKLGTPATLPDEAPAA